jgi:hypothetical protein
LGGTWHLYILTPWFSSREAVKNKQFLGSDIDDAEDPVFNGTRTMNGEDPYITEPIGGLVNVTPEVFICCIVADPDNVIRREYCTLCTGDGRGQGGRREPTLQKRASTIHAHIAVGEVRILMSLDSKWTIGRPFRPNKYRIALDGSGAVTK